MYEEVAGVLTVNTRASTNWCVCTFNWWLEQQNCWIAGNFEFRLACASSS